MGSQGTTAYVGLIPNNNARSDTRADILTSGAELVSWTDPLGLARASSMSYGTTTILYRTEAPSPGDVFLTVTKAASNSEWTYRRVIGALVPEGSRYIGRTITFAIKNPFIYEGAFTNPPYKESLDSSPSNPFLIKDFYVNQYALWSYNYMQTAGWKRIYKLPKSTTSARWAFWGKIIILKSYTHGLYEHYVVTFSLHYNSSEANISSYYIEPVIYRQLNTVGKILSKFRFARDPNNLNEVYLEGYYRTATTNYLAVFLRDFMSEGQDCVQHIMKNPDSQQKTAIDIYNNGLCDMKTSYPNDVILGAEVTTIEKSVLVGS